jgi:hypothetical protein
MRTALLSLFLLPIVTNADDKDCYPLKVGMRWTYRIEGQTDRYIVTAVKEEKIGEQLCVKFEARLRSRFADDEPAGIGLAGSSVAPTCFIEQLVGSEHVAFLKDGFYRFSFGGQPVEPPICFLKPSAEKGETWKHEFKIGVSQASAQFHNDVADVKVPAGNVSAAIVVRAEAIEKKEATKTTVWYARGVGMVKQVIDVGNDKVTLELERVQAPRD